MGRPGRAPGRRGPPARAGLGDCPEPVSSTRRLPIDTLKIAKPFGHVVVNGAKDGALAQAIVSLARSLQLQVVAEGIEEQAQLDVLVGMGCELGQGFLVSPPVAADLLPALARIMGEDAA